MVFVFVSDKLIGLSLSIVTSQLSNVIYVVQQLNQFIAFYPLVTAMIRLAAKTVCLMILQSNAVKRIPHLARKRPFVTGQAQSVQKQRVWIMELGV